ncbi:copper chaperone PCu(A)C [Streptomyces sp. SM10]|uniref:copper chaperone PCu(A)C n=1 Tax=Streptomyces sp. SM10 TaxID=565556 RepID=UPI000CDA646B|nr:copper chaperone PCu(A)C [Streptomyces sp. SM10]
MKNLRPPRSGRLRRARQAAATGTAVVVASLAAVGGLSAWTTAGYAGSPANIEVREARVLLPVMPGRDTNAYFHIVNTGGAPDRLRSVSSSAASDPKLTTHRMNAANGAYRERSGSVEIPAKGEVEMSPQGSAVTLRSDPSWRPGSRVTFTLDFQRSGTVTVQALVRPVTLGSTP